MLVAHRFLRPKRFYFLCALGVLVVLSVGLARGDSFYCGNRIVSIGKNRGTVEKLCGPPDFIDQRREEKLIEKYRKIHPRNAVSPIPDGGTNLSHQDSSDHSRGVDQNCVFVSRRRVQIEQEEWTYNLGPDRFMRMLIFRNDRLSEIQTGEYGFNKPPSSTDMMSAQVGDSKAVIFMKYGEPSYKNVETKEESSTRYSEDDHFVYVETRTVFVDLIEWIYDSDPNRLPKKLVFRNDRLISIE